MALKIIEFFGHKPLDPAAKQFSDNKLCPYIESACSKPNHGACSVRQTSGDPVICCPNRLYADSYRLLTDVGVEAFGQGIEVIKPDEWKNRQQFRELNGNEVVAFGHRWGRELPLPTPPGSTQAEKGKFYVDWVLAKLTAQGDLEQMTALEVQTIDTTGNYSDQSRAFFLGQPFHDKQGRELGYSNSGLNWENVNKRILPQLIYKGHVLRREPKCTKGLFFVCPQQVLERIRVRLGDNLHDYPLGAGTITFRSYSLGEPNAETARRDFAFACQFTTTVDQVALAFTSPRNLPDMGVYEGAIGAFLRR
ncbi:NotI family restriction endonuclease [Gimibacter soli]|uniref:NotI family restriction endonuclease n=1 Tax=Gimibacter soli TaxID=3024400 RepID=A0AAE9XRB4_9PROT|nr:NotI family restriction endonuclease [Gimibacter soli]WCL54851.1 NotI family restriction endonuclease [Gimibacter soli]